MSSAPQGYQRLKGSERRHSPSAEFLGVAHPGETFTVTIVLRRRPDGAPIPNHEFFLNTPPHHRQRMPESEFAALYGASDEDIATVAHFVTTHHLSVVQTHAARRTIVASGIVSSMESCFGVKLGYFKHQIALHRNEPETETYRGHHGFIHIPNNLADIVVGIFGLDNRTIVVRDSVDDADDDDSDDEDFEALTVPQVTGLYSFPDQDAGGQTIAILSHAGYKIGDVDKYFSGLGLSTPTITDVDVGDGTNHSNWSVKKREETTMDICISGSAAIGAAVAVYFSKRDPQAWVDLIKRVIFPDDGDPICSILSSSYHLYKADDDQDDDDWMDAINSTYEDAAIQGITVCNSSGDYGSYSNTDDGKTHVHFPASDPWVLTVGGTAIANVDDPPYVEMVWNHGKGATGGGVSAYFPLPEYQTSAGVPASLNDSSQTGRGVPDVAANADPRSCYKFPLIEADGKTYKNHQIGGTSAAAPLWAGFLARINASLGVNVGFINPALYSIGSRAFNDIDGSVGPTDNHVAGSDAPGYPAHSGWDACTGWGSINGTALLAALKRVFDKRCWVQPFVIRTPPLPPPPPPSVLSGPVSVSVPFLVKVNGFKPADFGVENVPPIQATSNPVITITSINGLAPSGIECTLEELVVEDDTLPPTPQIFTWVYRIKVTSKAKNLRQRVLKLLATVTTLDGYTVYGHAVIVLG